MTDGGGGEGYCWTELDKEIAQVAENRSLNGLPWTTVDGKLVELMGFELYLQSTTS